VRDSVIYPGVAPLYATRFACIGASCGDNCCADGWIVTVDRESYEGLRRVRVSGLTRRLRRALRRLPAPTEDHRYARIVYEPGCTTCPLLAEGLCEIHARMGEGWLCDTCFHYPRRVLEFAGEYSQTLSLSCPEAARLAFGTADALEIVTADVRARPSTMQHARPVHGLTLDAMLRVHRFCLRLMRRRDLALWQRLGVLGTLCEGLQGLFDAGRATDADALIGAVAADVEGGGAVAALASATPDLRRQALAFATLITEHPVPATSDVQRRVFSEVVRGLTGSEARQADADTVVAAYARGIGRLEDALRAVPHLLDHYVLNEMLAVGFPFERTAPMDAYRCLAGQFGTLRFLLAARCANDPFPDAEALVETACVFARRFAHDQRFAQAVGSPPPDHGWTSARSICSIVRT